VGPRGAWSTVADEAVADEAVAAVRTPDRSGTSGGGPNVESEPFRIWFGDITLI
jgi:hypothetical protein